MRPTFTQQQLSEAKERITCTGQSIAEWARDHEFDYQTTGHVLGGRLKAVRGEAFRVSVALGLRRAPPKKRTNHNKAEQQVAA